MTEDVQATVSQDQGSPVSNDVQNTSVENVETQKPAEKMLPQSVVDKIVGTRVKEAYERARRDADSNHQQQSSMGGMEQQSEEKIRELIRREAFEMSNRAMAEQIASEHNQRMKSGEERYPDFKEKYDSLNMSNHPQLVMWLRGLDNSADVVYDMAANPTKVSHILMLANSGFPELAEKELSKLSVSIKANDDAKKFPTANEPLDQLRPSNIGTDNGRQSVSDLRKQPWLFG